MFADPRIPDEFIASPTSHEVEIDASGLFCPIPIVKCAAALRKLTSGQVVKVISTDPGFVPDMLKWSRHRADKLVGLRQEGDSRWVGWVKKG